MAAWTPIVYALISAVGIIGNILFLRALMRDPPLRKLLSGNIRRLLLVHTSSDLLYASVGIPLYIMTLVYARWPVWNLYSFVCVLVNYTFWLLIHSSAWFLCALAFMRLIATVWPAYFRHSVSKSGWWLALVAVVPWLCAMSGFTVSLIVGWAEIYSSDGKFNLR